MINQSHFTDTVFLTTKSNTVSRDTEFAGQAEGFDPFDLDAIRASGSPDDEYIVKIDFSYCGVQYSGYQILTYKELGNLVSGVRSGVRIGTPNMPGSWYEKFDIDRLDGAFSIHSADPDDVSAMRSLFGESVGETSLFEIVLQAAVKDESVDEWEKPEYIDAVVAQRFLDNPDSVDLSTATGMDDDAAAVLAEEKQGELSLGGLTDLSDAAAQALAKHQGNLWLYGLTDLSDAAAEALAKHQGFLNLDGLTDLSDSAAQALAKHKGNLSLDGLSELTDTAAEYLSKYHGDLNLCGLTEISDTAANSLSNHQSDLTIYGLTAISDVAAECFSKHRGTLELGGLTEISDIAATALSKHESYLGLPGLTKLSDAAAEALSRHQGDLNLSGLTELSDTAALSLSKHQGDLWLESVDLSDNCAKALRGHRGNLVLDPDWIRSMDTSVSQILARKNGTICEQDPAEWVASLKS